MLRGSHRPKSGGDHLGPAYPGMAAGRSRAGAHTLRRARLLTTKTKLEVGKELRTTTELAKVFVCDARLR